MMNVSSSGSSKISLACCPVLDRLIGDDEAEQVARVFKALADPARVKLLSLIATSPGGEDALRRHASMLGRPRRNDQFTTPSARGV